MTDVLTTDGCILFGTRLIRMFAYGFLSVVLVLYLAQLGLSEARIGLLLSLTLIGDAAISLWMTTRADRLGRRRILIAGAGLMLFAGVLFALTDRVTFLLIAAIIGVISPSGYEARPFLPVEQAALSQIVPEERRTQVFAWYNLVGSFATATGTLGGGGLTQLLQQAGVLPLNSYRTIVILYGVIGLLLALLFTRLSSSVEIAHSDSARMRFHLGLHRSRGVVLKLSAAAGVTGIARSVGAAISPTFAGAFLSNSVLLSAPFFVAGGLKSSTTSCSIGAFEWSKGQNRKRRLWKKIDTLPGFFYVF
jgi:MFS family permease